MLEQRSKEQVLEDELRQLRSMLHRQAADTLVHIAETSRLLELVNQRTAWQPIETAPDMGVWLGAKLSDSGNYWEMRVSGRRFSGEDYFFQSTDATLVKNCPDFRPTHWMPLPDAPSVNEAKSEIDKSRQRLIDRLNKSGIPAAVEAVEHEKQLRAIIEGFDINELLAVAEMLNAKKAPFSSAEAEVDRLRKALNTIHKAAMSGQKNEAVKLAIEFGSTTEADDDV
jgi:hypothetical protein